MKRIFQNRFNQWLFSQLHPKYRTPYKSNLLFLAFVGFFAAFIPGDIDRTLLIDLASHIDASFDLDDTSRYALRDRFWDHIDRVKLT